MFCLLDYKQLKPSLSLHTLNPQNHPNSSLYRNVVPISQIHNSCPLTAKLLLIEGIPVYCEIHTEQTHTVMVVCFIVLYIWPSILCVLCFCLLLCIVSPLVHSCLFSICVQIYWPLPLDGNPIAVNKYHINYNYFLLLNHLHLTVSKYLHKFLTDLYSHILTFPCKLLLHANLTAYHFKISVSNV